MKFHKIALFLVAVMSIFTLSCQHRVEEPRVIATVDDMIVVSKRVNQTFASGEVDFTIKLDGGTFNGVTNTKSTLIVGGEDVGLTISAPVSISSGASSGTFRITGTPTKTLSGSIKMQIPDSYINGRVNPVTVEAKNMYWNITDNTTPYAEISGSTSYPYWTFDKVKTTGYIQLENAYLKDVADGMDITTWINPNSNVAPNLKFYLSIDESQEYKDRFYIIIDGSLNDSELIYFCAMSIPTKYLHLNGNYTKDRVYISKRLSVGIAEGRRTVGVSFTKCYEIKGEFNVTTPKSISYEIPITLQGMTFKANEESRDVSKWFAHTVQGLSYTLSPVIEGSKTATITIEGVPGDASDAAIEFALNTTLTSTELAEIFNYSAAIAWAFDTKGSHYNITVPSDQFAYHIYDLASFGDTSLLTTSPNRAFTKTYDVAGSVTAIAFGDGNVIYTGSSKTVSFPGFTRGGYKLAGFARLSEDGTVNPDPASIAYKMGDSGNVTEDPTTHKLTLNLDDADKGKVTKLYAVWTRDESSPYFKVADTITITKTQVEAANPDADNETDDAKKANYLALNDLKMHDGVATLADDWTQEFKFYALPGGKITDTDYYKWPVSWTSNENPSTYGNIMNDFAISDIALTPALWNVVYAWATADDRGDNKYTFNFDQSSTLLAGVLYSNSSSRHSAEDPLVRINWYNAVVFANALTEWYNTVVLTDAGSEKLAVAYTEDGTAAGKPIRDASLDSNSRNAVLDMINSGENNVNTSDATRSGLKRVPGATGFRLPTRAEWQYAASVLPNGIPTDWDESVTTHTRNGFMYPYCQNYAYASGVDGGVATTNTKLKDYAVYSELYYTPSSTLYGTQAVGKYFVQDSVRTNGAKPNALGIYDMSGNIWEWNEEWYGSGTATSPYTISSRFVSGGSWGTNASSLYVGRANNNTPSNRADSYGIRFCRALSPKTN